MNIARIALPGYNALTDTDPDHFSLFADADNVLIKRKLKGSQTIVDGSPTTVNIPHSLGYIPFFMAYYDQNSDGHWSILNNQYNNFSVPDAVAGIDSSNLTLLNFGGHASGDLPVAYDVFYDDMALTGNPAITESGQGVKIARPGKSAFSLNPNDYILHTDLNSFKILKQGVVSLTLPSSTGLVSFAHGADVQTPFKFFCFIKFPDGKTFLTGNAAQSSYNNTIKFVSSTMDATNINIKALTVPSDTAIQVYYLIYGTGKAGTIIKPHVDFTVPESGIDPFKETNPDNFRFHPSYPTLKYYFSGSYSFTATDTTTIAIAHGLSYTPFFITFVSDLAGTLMPGKFCIVPNAWGRSSLAHPNQDISAFAYADSTNIYLRALYGANAVGTSVVFNFYYKIFRNNLGL